VDTKTFILDLAKFLGPGLFVFFVSVLALILFGFLSYAFRRSTIWVKYESGKGFSFIKVEPPEKIEELKLPEPPEIPDEELHTGTVPTKKTKKSKQVK
jgi:hypothetical protein